jgi:hypothetical protein
MELTSNYCTCGEVGPLQYPSGSELMLTTFCVTDLFLPHLAFMSHSVYGTIVEISEVVFTYNSFTWRLEWKETNTKAGRPAVA